MGQIDAWAWAQATGVADAAKRRTSEPIITIGKGKGSFSLGVKPGLLPFSVNLRIGKGKRVSQP